MEVRGHGHAIVVRCLHRPHVLQPPLRETQFFSLPSPPSPLPPTSPAHLTDPSSLHSPHMEVRGHGHAIVVRCLHRPHVLQPPLRETQFFSLPSPPSPLPPTSPAHLADPSSLHSPHMEVRGHGHAIVVRCPHRPHVLQPLLRETLSPVFPTPPPPPPHSPPHTPPFLDFPCAYLTDSPSLRSPHMQVRIKPCLCCCCMVSASSSCTSTAT